MVFSERGELDLPAAFLAHQKILIVAKVIAGQRSEPVYISVARAIFKRDLLRITIFKLQNLSSTIFERSSPNFQHMF